LLLKNEGEGKRRREERGERGKKKYSGIADEKVLTWVALPTWLLTLASPV
jgi:hypothetical protein